MEFSMVPGAILTTVVQMTDYEAVMTLLRKVPSLPT
jgi:hypothetical protein